MKKNIHKVLTSLIIVLISFNSVNQVFAQNNAKGIDTITEKELYKHLSFIASDELKGRKVFTPEAKITARYIATELEYYGIKPIMPNNSYFMEVPFEKKTIKNSSQMVIKNGNNSESLEYGTGFSTSFTKAGNLAGEVIFLGYGASEKDLDWDDISNINLKNKVAVILNGRLPRDHKVAKTNRNSSVYSRASRLVNKGAKAVILISKADLFADYSSTTLQGSALGRGISNLPLFRLDLEKGANLLEMTEGKLNELFKSIENGNQVKNQNFNNLKISIDLEIETEIEITYNVLGVVEGSDPVKKNEYVAISAHYDHLGVRNGQIYNGADDDGSGVVALLEIAQAYSTEQPKRSILLIWHTAEEIGLKGAEYFVRNSPVPLEKISGLIDFDMVGRTATDSVIVVGTKMLSTELDAIIEDMNDKYIKLGFNYNHNTIDDPERFYFRSDHYRYAQVGIPAMYFTGPDHIDYHKPTDTVEKINFPTMVKITKLTYLITQEIANRDEMLKLDVDPNFTKRGKR